MRLPDYDYSSCGAYFVTVCTQNRECLFGEIIDGEMELNEYGSVVQEYLDIIQMHFPNVETDMTVIMPNHVHKIMIINSNCRGEVASPSLNVRNPLKQGGETPPLRDPLLGQIVAYFKYQTTKHINQNRNTPGLPVWQRNYYDRIIRNEIELHQIRKYIQNNPVHWDIGQVTPENL